MHNISLSQIQELKTGLEMQKELETRQICLVKAKIYWQYWALTMV